MPLKDKLKELRTGKKKTQSEVASFLGIDRSTYGKYETGDSFPDLEKLLQISAYFNVSTDYLLGKTNVKIPDRIANALQDDPELSEFWNTLQEREDLQLLFKQTRNLSPKDIRQIIRVIKAIEEEEDKENS
jgi:transcriptional regulator with XRE-family HTH domain